MLKEFISIDRALDLGKMSKRKLELKDRIEEFNVLFSNGKMAAEEIVAPNNFPSENRSAVDGYSVNSKYVISASGTNNIELKIVGESTPESPFEGKIKPDESVRVLTGARIPDGSDAVVMDEDSVVVGKILKVNKGLRSLQNVSYEGEDLRKGDLIAHRGDIIDPFKVVAMIETGIRTVSTLNIRVGILSTGDELLKGKVKNSTQYFLMDIMKRYGYTPVNLGLASDNIEDINSKANIDISDILIITGGTGPSEKDYVGKFIEASGDLVFHGIKMRPGRTTGFGIIDGRPVFAISGLPVASLMAFENIIDPLIRYWFNLSQRKRYYIKAELTRPIVNTLGFRSFVRVKVHNNGEKYLAEPFKVTGSGIISSLMNADGIVIVHEDVEGYGEGSPVDVELIRC